MNDSAAGRVGAAAGRTTQSTTSIKERTVPTIELPTADGPLAIEATEPVPGLRVFEIPADRAPLPDYPWVLAHHEGRTLGLFATADDAHGAAAAVASLADWTRSVMTTANEISLGGNVERFGLALMVHGCAPTSA